MTLFDTNAITRRPTIHASEDLIRLALILMTLATLSLGLMLAARMPGSPLAATDYTGIDWHGNVAASGR